MSNSGSSKKIKQGKKKKDEKSNLFILEEAIPLLIIDVNIRAGEKKKIYVFDGDTAEGLADKFAREHSLDQDTSNKLMNLIQSHMSRLLMRIDEENPSISEVSSNAQHML